MEFLSTIPCERPAVAAWSDSFGNQSGEPRAAAAFEAVFVPPGAGGGSRIVDGILRETTITKPTLYVNGRPDVVSGDPIIIGGEGGWEVDGDPVTWPSAHPWTGWHPPMIIELRRAAG